MPQDQDTHLEKYVNVFLKEAGVELAGLERLAVGVPEALKDQMGEMVWGSIRDASPG